MLYPGKQYHCGHKHWLLLKREVQFEVKKYVFPGNLDVRNLKRLLTDCQSTKVRMALKRVKDTVKPQMALPQVTLLQTKTTDQFKRDPLRVGLKDPK